MGGDIMATIKIKVTAIEWKSKKVEYICEVEEDEYKERKHYGIGYLDGGDLGTDAEGFDGFEISKKIIDNDWEFKTTDVEWEEIKE